MSSEEVLKHFEGNGESDVLYHFLSNLFLLFDNHLPPVIEHHVKELLDLLNQQESAYFSEHYHGEPVEPLQAA